MTGRGALALLVVLVCAASADLSSFVARFDLSKSHVGVAFDVVHGRPAQQRIFAAAEASADPLAHDVSYEVTPLVSVRALHEAYAHRAHVDLVPGMYTQAPPLQHMPGGGDAAVYWATRTEELLHVKLQRQGALDIRFKAALDSLPDTFEASNSLWEHFFRRFSTHWIDSAVLGGLLSVSSSFRPGEKATPLRIKHFLESLLRHGSVPRSEADLLEQGNHFVTTLGGDSSLVPTHVDASDVQGSHLHAWLASLPERPAVVRYGLRSMADLIQGQPRKRLAMQDAIRHHLAHVYEEWRARELQHDENLKALAALEQGLRGDVDQLERKMREMQTEMQSQATALNQCEADHQRVTKDIEACVQEKKTYQAAVLKCDARNYQYEHFEKEFLECSKRNREVGCSDTLRTTPAPQASFRGFSRAGKSQ